MVEFQQHTFPNGLRLVHIPDISLVAHFGVVFGTGSRDEMPNEHGMAHFIEHMLFKGTKTRKPYHILSRMEDVGGEIDAYTTKEFIVINSSFPKQFFNRAVELIADLSFNSTFPEKEIAKEKEVVAEEINMYKDSPSELIFDVFDELLYSNNPMGRNILGTEKSLKSFSHKSLNVFWNRQINPSKTVICSAGNIRFQSIISIAEKYFTNFGQHSSPMQRQSPEANTVFTKTIRKKTHQAHCIIGTQAFDAHSKHRLSLRVLTNLLGGPGMNSRLNLMLREKHGLVYQVDAFYYPSSDCGNFGVYFGTDADNVERCKDLVMKEISRITNQKLGTMQLHNAKRQLLGQVILGSENTSSVMLSTAKSVLVHNRIWTVEDILAEIESINEIDLQNTASELFNSRELSTLLFL
jgi:predicted Zn-dependent peptidase